MKLPFRCGLSTLLATWLLGTGTGQGASLLSNAGFEFDPGGHNQTLNGWFTFGANNYNETGTGHGGTNYYKVYQAFTGAANYTGIYQDYISGPGAVYNADGWAYTANADAIAGQNQSWLEVSFRDASANVLALYRSAIISTNALANGKFAKNTWTDLGITNQYDPNTYQATGTVSKLVAPAGTYFVRYQAVFAGDAAYSGGSVYYDDLNLTSAGGQPYGSYNITWSDEFNGNTINPAVWTYDLGGGGWGNQELEYYTSRSTNAYATNGLLHIVARKEASNGYNYTSARVKSQGLFACKYGRVEWRAKLPSGTGMWPALWFLGTNITQIGWPGCGEIDLLENNGSNIGMAQGSIHSGSDATAIYNFTDGLTTTNFHTYTLDWSTNALLFYVDGHLYQTQTSWSSSNGSYPFPFNQPFFLIMNVAVGGNYVGNPSTNDINSGTVFPQEMQVDYVRLYNLTAPLQMSLKKNGQNLVIDWPSNIVCRLQSQTNPAALGLGTNWLVQATSTNQYQISPAGGSGYYRLVSP